MYILFLFSALFLKHKLVTAIFGYILMLIGQRHMLPPSSIFPYKHLDVQNDKPSSKSSVSHSSHAF